MGGALIENTSRRLRELPLAAVSRLMGRAPGVRDFRREPPGEGARVLIPGRGLRVEAGGYAYRGARPYWMDLGEVRLDPVLAVPVRGADVVSGGAVVAPDGDVLLESTIFQREYLDRLGVQRLLRARRFLSPQRVGRVVPLGNSLDCNYYHWVMESLTRLAVLDGRTLGEHGVLVRTGSPGFVRASLEHLFGVGGDRLVEQARARVTAEECLVVSFPHVRNEATRWTNVYHPEAIVRLNRIALGRVGGGGAGGGGGNGGGRNLLISRAGAGERRLLNERELVARYPHLGLQVVRPETLSFAEQVRVFADARLVVGVHGAGLTNIVFSRSPTVIELFPSGRDVRDAFYFAQISMALGFRHVALECPQANAAQDVRLTAGEFAALDALVDAAAAAAAGGDGGGGG